MPARSRLRARLLSRSGALLRRIGVRRHRDDVDHTVRAASRVMRGKRYCLLVTEGPDGADARVVQPFRPDGALTVHLGAGAGSRKARQVSATGRAVLVYERDRDAACVVAHCSARLVDDPAVRHRYFMPMWHAFWPDGPDHDFVVIRCEPYAVEVWDARRGVTPAPFGLRSARLVRGPDGWRFDEPPLSQTS